MRHVGNGNQQPPAVARFLAIDRIVEIARVGAIDRYEVHVAKVRTTLLRV